MKCACFLLTIFLAKPQGSSAPQNANGINQNHHLQTMSTNVSHHVCSGNPGIRIEDLAATRIQSAFRAYRVSFGASYAQ